ncbi:hypothetical protein ACHQM5_007984 [Ranunculus cassubicifolius]
MADFPPSVDPANGFCSETKTFHSLRPSYSLPPHNSPLSASQYAITLFHNSSFSPSNTTAVIDSTTGQRLSYSQFFLQTQNLALYLQNEFGLSRGDVAFVLSPNCLQIPILFFSLLSLGVVVSPANPTSTKSEISRQLGLCKATIAFATSDIAHKLPFLRYETILLDSPKFLSMMIIPRSDELITTQVIQSDPAAILYSSGTTGKVKGVVLTHRNLTSTLAGVAVVQKSRETPAVMLYTVPYFHVYGFFFALRSVAVAETVVLLGRFGLESMMKAIEEFRVTTVALSPPVIVSMLQNNDAIKDYDSSSLESVACGGAALGMSMIERFRERFPKVQLAQGYGLTESTGVAFRPNNPEESSRYGAAGRLVSNFEAKIVDPNTAIALSPCKVGELWIKGPTIMKGYVEDEEATSKILDYEGWLRTGDACYIDSDGYLFVVDRFKELIKYKGHQVSPSELEQLLRSHIQVVDVAVVAYHDEVAGEIPLAFVVRQPHHVLGEMRESHSMVDESQIIKFVAKQVAPYKRIRRVMFIDSIPKNAAGKIMRTELKQLASKHISKL